MSFADQANRDESNSTATVDDKPTIDDVVLSVDRCQLNGTYTYVCEGCGRVQQYRITPLGGRTPVCPSCGHSHGKIVAVVVRRGRWGQEERRIELL